TGLMKPVLFGFIIATVGCYYGISARGGTQGVGRATTQAVVASSVLIIAVDFFATRLILSVFGYRCIMAAPPTAVESPLRTTEQRQSPAIVFEDVSIAFES